MRRAEPPPPEAGEPSRRPARRGDAIRDLERLRPLAVVASWIVLSLPVLLAFFRDRIGFVTAAERCLAALLIALVAVGAMAALLRRYASTQTADDEDDSRDGHERG